MKFLRKLGLSLQDCDLQAIMELATIFLLSVLLSQDRSVFLSGLDQSDRTSGQKFRAGLGKNVQF